MGELSSHAWCPEVHAEDTAVRAGGVSNRTEIDARLREVPVPSKDPKRIAGPCLVSGLLRRCDLSLQPGNVDLCDFRNSAERAVKPSPTVKRKRDRNSSLGV